MESPSTTALIFTDVALPSEEFSPGGCEGALMATEDTGDGASGYHPRVFR